MISFCRTLGLLLVIQEKNLLCDLDLIPRCFANKFIFLFKWQGLSLELMGRKMKQYFAKKSITHMD